MNYNEFKKTIESVQIVDKEFYENLVNLYGENVIEALFKRYLLDSKIPDNSDKFNRTIYYVENYASDIDFEQSENEQDLNDNSLNLPMKESFSIYISQISEKPLLTPEEELKICQKIDKLKKTLKNRGLDKEILKEQVKNAGIIDNSYDFAEAINYLKQKTSLNEETNVLDLELLNNLRIYQMYNELVNTLMSANLRLVISIAKHFKLLGMEMDDFVQEGNIGLRKAVEKFEVDKGYKFSTYATWWIKQAISRSIADSSRTIRIPVHTHELIKKIKNITKELEQTLGKQPTEEEILHEFNKRCNQKLNLQQLRYYEQVIISPVSLSTPVGEDEDSILGEFVPDEKPSVEEMAMVGVYEDYIKSIITSLTSREKLVLILRSGLSLEQYMDIDEFENAVNTNQNYSNNTITKAYNFLSNNPRHYTLEETGKLFNVTRERIRQIEAKSLRKLRFKTKNQSSILR